MIALICFGAIDARRPVLFLEIRDTLFGSRV